MSLFAQALPALVLFAQDAHEARAGMPTWVIFATIGVIVLVMIGVIVITAVLLLVLSRRSAQSRRLPAQIPDHDAPVKAPDAIRSGQPPPRNPGSET
jgi:Flp pilus assembly protein TadB